MKRTFFVLVVLLIAFASKAQYKKLPLDTNHYWHELFFYMVWPSPYSSCDYQYNITKDTLIGSNLYQKVMLTNKVCNPSWTCCFNSPYQAFLRQDTIRKLVLALNSSYQEKIIYNFNKILNDTVMLYDGSSMSTYTVNLKDSLLLNDGLYHKRLGISGTGVPGDLIEGVGGSRGLLTNYSQGIGIGANLICLGKIYPSQSTIYHQSGNSFSCSIVSSITETSNKKNETNVLVSPNPGHGLINVSISNKEKINSLIIKDILGKEIKRISGISLNQYLLDLTPFENGVYFLVVESPTEIFQKKIIKN